MPQLKLPSFAAHRAMLSQAYSSIDQHETDDPAFRTSEEGEKDIDDITPARSTFKRESSQKRFYVSFFINLILIFLLVGTLAVHRSSRGDEPKPNKLLYSPLPDFPKEIKMFSADPLYLSLPTQKSNQAWDNLHGQIIAGEGFIRLDNESALMYPSPEAGLSVFHQLHCLASLRLFMWQLLHDEVDRDKMLQTWPDDLSIDKPTYEQATQGLWHYGHCFDYLRQSLQCAGDVSLEFMDTSTGNRLVDGFHTPHECTNWESLREWSSEHGN